MTRLIDADALKKDKFTTKIANGVELEDIEVVPVPSIDNAPTVEVPENEVNCVLTMFGECSYNKTGCSDCEIKDKIRKALSEKENLEKKNEFLMQQIRLWQSSEQQEGDCEEVKYIDDSMYQYNPKYMEALDMAIDYMKKQNKLEEKVDYLINELMKQIWYSVDEELPEMCKAVLVWCPERFNIFCANLNYDKQWEIFGTSNLLYEKVVAWRELPTYSHSRIDILEKNQRPPDELLTSIKKILITYANDVEKSASDSIEEVIDVLEMTGDELYPERKKNEQ